MTVTIRALVVASVALTLLAIGAIGAPAAHAQRSPDTATLDRSDGLTRVGIDFGLTFLEEPPAPYDSTLRFEPYGQWVSNSGFGLYGALPITKSFGDGIAPMPEPDLTVGNFELGALFVTSGETTSWVFRGGVALPTAGDGRDAVATNRVGSAVRATDIALAQPDATYVRLAISPLVHTSRVFLRFDAGLDLGIDSGDTPGDPLHYLRLNVGGGVDLGVLAIGLELVNSIELDDEGDDEDVLHTLAFTVRFMGEAFQPVLAIGTPLDDSGRDAVDVFVALGFQVVL